MLNNRTFDQLLNGVETESADLEDSVLFGEDYLEKYKVDGKKIESTLLFDFY
jgi:hypothetical protein